MRFLGNVLAVIIGLFLFFLFGFFAMLLLIAVAGSGKPSVDLKNNSVLELDLSKVNHDYAGKVRFKDLDYFAVSRNGLSDVLAGIEEAKTDQNIKGISIINPDLRLGPAQLKALRDALADFRKSGKFVLAYADVYEQKDYYLASIADTVYIHPTGSLEFKGLSAEILFFKDLQEKSGVNVEVVRHGKYKSAVEPFLQNNMSEANREQVSSLLHSVWQSMIADISTSRKKDLATLNKIAEDLSARMPEMAKAQGLVDKIVYEDLYHNDIRKLLDVKADKKYNKIKILDYAEKIGNTAGNFSVNDEIAVIYAQGEILSGEGDVGFIGEGSMNRAIRQARRDDNIKAVVLRVDSPGGSALTSELIWRELELTKKVKPVVVSMGNTAASGGYYIACNANQIFAEASTITGSIGVFGMLPNLTKLAEKVGVHAEQVSTHSNAAGYSAFLPLTDRYRGLVQEEIERIYNTFVMRVADGRKMSFAQVDQLAQGRIWSGQQALEAGLVDKIGGMDEAIKAAAKLAKTDNYNIRNFPEYEKNFMEIFQQMGIPFVSSSKLIEDEIGAENLRLWQKIKMATKRTGVQVMLPFEILIN